MKYKDFRMEKKMTQKEAAEYFGISLRTYIRYEKSAKEIETKFSAQEIAGPRPIDVATDSFEKLRKGNFFYVDKTALIEDLVSLRGSEVALFTRPRRFGKSLNLSMLKSFFSLDSDPSLFRGLYISTKRQIVEEHQGKYPTFFMSLKDAYGLTLNDFLSRFAHSLSLALAPFAALADSAKLEESDKDFLAKALRRELDPVALSFSLRYICKILRAHYERSAVVLLDEYDVPLEKASSNGYYQQALDFMETLFSSGFKGNPDVAFAVLTGCLRSGKENLFTGFNNARIYDVLDEDSSSFFGFTDEEVRLALEEYGLSAKEEEVRRYYDGYRQGGESIYCPFDVVNYILDHRANPNAPAKFYWRNSSSNEIIYRMLEHASPSLKDDVETLLEGNSVRKSVNLSLSYRDLLYDEDNVYSLLLSTGYLTAGKGRDGVYDLWIPNEEIKSLFKTQISRYVDKSLSLKYGAFPGLLDLTLSGNEERLSSIFNAFFMETIGIHDYARKETDREGFYHGLILGIYSSMKRSSFISVHSNRESGEGFPDIVIDDLEENRTAILEVKYASEGNFDAAIEEGMSQIKEKNYGQKGNCVFGVIACYKKRCVVKFR